MWYNNKIVLIVTFVPTKEKDFAADLIFNTNDPVKPTYTLNLTGKGVPDEATIVVKKSESILQNNKEVLDFGLTQINDQSFQTISIGFISFKYFN